MQESGNFNINNTEKPINTDLAVVFSPAKNIKAYTYNLYKNDNVIETKTINQNTPYTFNLTETGNYKIVINMTDETNVVKQTSSGLYTIDKEKPVITLKYGTKKSRKCFNGKKDFYFFNVLVFCDIFLLFEFKRGF